MLEEKVVYVIGRAERKSVTFNRRVVEPSSPCAQPASRPMCLPEPSPKDRTQGGLPCQKRSQIQTLGSRKSSQFQGIGQLPPSSEHLDLVGEAPVSGLKYEQTGVERGAVNIPIVKTDIGTEYVVLMQVREPVRSNGYVYVSHLLVVDTRRSKYVITYTAALGKQRTDRC